ncbi:hypothetical protein C8J57DRAFT_1246154 [Mycena rebaudengoi]|nr:hypothetical protein C8J57DRAFT_1246154 [Mycena rebaudengoi]
MAKIFENTRAIFGKNVPKDMFALFGYYGGTVTTDHKRAHWCIANSIEDTVFIETTYGHVSETPLIQFIAGQPTFCLQVMTIEFIFEMVREEGRVYAPTYALAVDSNDEVVPAAAIFNYEHPAFGPQKFNVTGKVSEASYLMEDQEKIEHLGNCGEAGLSHAPCTEDSNVQNPVLEYSPHPASLELCFVAMEVVRAGWK